MSKFLTCQDRESRTCIQVFRDSKIVKYIPLDIFNGLVLHETTPREFDAVYKPLPTYPVERACQLYVSYSLDIGATTQALDAMRQIITISDEVYKIATRKTTVAGGQVKPVVKAEKKPVVKAEKKPVVKAEKKPVVKAEKKPVVKAEKKPQKSAARMFQELIMEGKLTDAKIFTEVQSVFNLGEDKRHYVKWYRSSLKKAGLNPPEPLIKKMRVI